MTPTHFSLRTNIRFPFFIFLVICRNAVARIPNSTSRTVAWNASRGKGKKKVGKKSKQSCVARQTSASSRLRRLWPDRAASLVYLSGAEITWARFFSLALSISIAWQRGQPTLLLLSFHLARMYVASVGWQWATEFERNNAWYVRGRVTCKWPPARW